MDKRATAADEANSGNATGYDTVAAGWLGEGCGTHGVRALRLLHRATANKRARAAPCRDLAYQRYHLELCWNRPEALVSDGRALSGLQHSSDLLSWDKVTCVRNPVCARACMHYDCCAGQHKVANKGARAAPSMREEKFIIRQLPMINMI